MNTDILIAYYSWSGNTRKIAELIAGGTGGTPLELEPVQPYSTDYRTVVEQAKKEIRSGARPELKNLPESIWASIIFLGTPNWWNTMAPPLASFLDRFDWRGKTIVPFYTHGGGGGGSIERDVTGRCPNAAVKEGFGAYNNGGTEAIAQVDAWLGSIELLSRNGGSQ